MMKYLFNEDNYRKNFLFVNQENKKDPREEIFKIERNNQLSISMFEYGLVPSHGLDLH